MALITLLNAQLAYGHVALLDHADFALETGERVGLIGRNGAGKSSLLKILAGLERADDGTLQLQQGLRIAYVAQEPVLDLEGTVFEAVRESVADVIALIDQYTHGHGDLDRLQGADRGPGRLELGTARRRNAAAAASGRRRRDRHALGRKPQAGGAGPGVGAPAGRAAAGRADQPPRPGLDRVAGEPADRLQGQRGHHHPRPHLPRPGRHPHRRTGPRPPAFLSRQFHPVPAPEGRTAGAGSRDHRQGRQAAGAGGGLGAQGRGGPAHPRPGPHHAAGTAARAAARRGARPWAASGWTLRPACPAARSSPSSPRSARPSATRSSCAISPRPSCAATRSA